LKLTSSKFIYKNLGSKQKIADKNPREVIKKDIIPEGKVKKQKEEDEENEEEEEHDSNMFFSKKVYNMINDDVSIYKNKVDEKIFDVFYRNSKKEDSIISVENFIEMFENEKFSEKMPIERLNTFFDDKPFNIPIKSPDKNKNSNLFIHTSLYNNVLIKNEEEKKNMIEGDLEINNGCSLKKDLSMNLKKKIGFLKQKSMNSIKINLIHNNILFREAKIHVNIKNNNKEFDLFRNAKKTIPPDKLYNNQNKIKHEGKNHSQCKHSFSKISFPSFFNTSNYLRPQTSSIKSLILTNQEFKTERSFTDRFKNKLNSVNMQFSSKTSLLNAENFSINFSAQRNITLENNKKNKQKVYTLQKLSKIKSYPKQLQTKKIERLQIESIVDLSDEKRLKSGREMISSQRTNKSQNNIFHNRILSKRIRMNNSNQNIFKSTR
jgi:hypothetical protein